MLASLQALSVPCRRAPGDVALIAKRFEAVGFHQTIDLDSAETEWINEDTTLDGRLKHIAKLYIEAATSESTLIRVHVLARSLFIVATRYQGNSRCVAHLFVQSQVYLHALVCVHFAYQAKVFDQQGSSRVLSVQLLAQVHAQANRPTFRL